MKSDSLDIHPALISQDCVAASRVPEGQMKIAQRFNAGMYATPGKVPKGRLKDANASLQFIVPRPSNRFLDLQHPTPNIQRPASNMARRNIDLAVRGWRLDVGCFSAINSA